MHLFAALVPPAEILSELDAAVASVRPHDEGPDDATRAPTSHRKERSRFKLPGTRTSAKGPQPHNLLERVPVQQMMIPVSSFGRLTTGDQVRLTQALREEAAGWAAPELRFSGGTALEWPGDTAVWSKVSGDVNRLQHIGRGVPPVAQRLTLFVDRRMFRPWMMVGTITDDTNAAYLEDLVQALERFRGEAWVQQTVCLFRSGREDDSVPELLAEMPLAPG